MRVLLTVLALLISPLATAAQPLSVQEALLRGTPAVALVIAEVGGVVSVRCGAAGPARDVTPTPYRETGTGWFVDSSGWLITNGHVVAAAHRPPSALLRDRAAQAIREACPGASASGATAVPALEPSITVLLPNGFKLPATVVKYSPPVAGEALSGQDLALLRLEASDMPTLPLGDSASLQIGDKLHIVGFPAVVLGHELLNATAKMEVSVTSGAVSGFRQDRANQPVIQTDAPAASGNSGGPALNDAGEVVGVLTFVTLSSDAERTLVQGFNFIIPSAAVAKFLEGTAVSRRSAGRFNAAWHAGLRHYFLGNYRRAHAHLAEANRLLPELPDVRRVTVDNEARQAREPWLPWRTIAVAMLVVSGAGYAALAARHWRRNQFRISPSEVARLVDTADPPVILDVRDAAAYAKSPVKIPRSVHAPLDSLERDRLPTDLTRAVVAYCT
jgi:S1-C subfamily serine protease